jgi:hypothetical protein
LKKLELSAPRLGLEVLRIALGESMGYKLQKAHDGYLLFDLADNTLAQDGLSLDDVEYLAEAAEAVRAAERDDRRDLLREVTSQEVSNDDQAVDSHPYRNGASA